jgi:hypothetical protein
VAVLYQRLLGMLGGCTVIRNDILECFILGYALDMQDDGFGRPIAFAQLRNEVTEKCGDCSNDELLDALYNLQTDHTELGKFFPHPSGYELASFEDVRNTAHWKSFFYGDPFRLKVLPPGRVRFQRLQEQLRQELQPVEAPPVRRPIGFVV